MDIKLNDLLEILPDTVCLMTNNNTIPEQYRFICISTKEFKNKINTDNFICNRIVEMIFPIKIKSFIPLVETSLVIRLKVER